ncbi:NAD(P)-dependent oxidoreductase [Pectobacterium cacticida]|uniref:NAD(P)-dependent oxidoreductase n=1 Tax=Pectobacterium cacticida TaxID=69221 RepID=A0ABZ2G8Q8_9GAMM|nr:NAD(P)-dependent oxidoreductase [Pectobacterium cacticida]UYX07831.1 NAD(P)-dependent oxidoreductase [Pectobacterium cacticida]
MMNLPKVTVLGLGAMGHAFANNLLKKGFTVAAWNRSPGREDDLVPHGLTFYTQPQQAVADADVIISILSDAEATLSVLAEIAPASKPQAIYCQMGTIGVQETLDAIALLKKIQPTMQFVDAPVSGTKAPAENAQILVLASGEKEKCAAAEQVFAAISRGTQWFGAAGNSQKMKLVLNAWLISMMQGVAESALLAKHLGFSPEQFWRALEGGPLAAPYVKVKLDAIAEHQFAPQMQLVHALKDAKLALALASQGTMPVLDKIADVWQKAVEDGFADQDLSSVYQWLEHQSSHV